MYRHITYANHDMSISAAKCVESALKHGCSSSDDYSHDDLNFEFWVFNSDILKQERGAGYWLWKPYIIYRELCKYPQGSYIIYTDAGVEFVNDVKHIITDNNVFLFGNHYPHLHWCKGEVSEAIGYNYGLQIQASAMVFRVSDEAKELVKKWLLWCQMPGMIDDSPSKGNHPGFQEHRHDQAILTCLTSHYRYHWWPATYNNGGFDYPKGEYKDEYPVIFHHHRKRNNEW
jgi:hypothetical protein